MKLTYEEHVDATIVKAAGRITIGAGDVQLREGVHEVAGRERHAVILDLGKVSHIDSSGVGELVALHRNLDCRGIRLCLTHVNAKIYGLLDLTRLITVFEVFDSNEDALQSLQPAAA